MMQSATSFFCLSVVVCLLMGLLTSQSYKYIWQAQTIIRPLCIIYWAMYMFGHDLCVYRLSLQVM